MFQYIQFERRKLIRHSEASSILRSNWTGYFTDGNYMRDISVEEIADSSGLNRSYFSRIFKDTFGESPSVFC